jgi:hypothetical protein
VRRGRGFSPAPFSYVQQTAFTNNDAHTTHFVLQNKRTHAFSRRLGRRSLVAAAATRLFSSLAAFYTSPLLLFAPHAPRHLGAVDALVILH